MASYSVSYRSRSTAPNRMFQSADEHERYDYVSKRKQCSILQQESALLLMASLDPSPGIQSGFQSRFYLNSPNVFRQIFGRLLRRPVPNAKCSFYLISHRRRLDTRDRWIRGNDMGRSGGWQKPRQYEIMFHLPQQSIKSSVYGETIKRRIFTTNVVFQRHFHSTDPS